MNNYKIDVPHFYCLEYCEGDKKMFVEMDFRDSFFILNRKLITNWESPYQDLIISEIEKGKILENIKEYLIQRTLPSNVIMED